MLIQSYESIKKIQTPNWIKSLLLSVPTVRTLQPVRHAVKSHYLLLLRTRSNPAQMRFAPAPNLVSHLQVITVNTEQCIRHQLTIRFIWLVSVAKVSMPQLRKSRRINLAIFPIQENIKSAQLHSVAKKSPSKLHAISKKFKLKSMFVSRTSPRV